MTDQNDPFSDASSNFIKPREDLMGRLALIAVNGIKTDIPSNLPNGKSYDAIECDIHILSGDITPKLADNGLKNVPGKIEATRLSGSALVPQLRGKVGKPQNMVLGRFAERKGNFPTPAVVLDPPTEQDKVVARQYLATLDPFSS